MPVEELEPTPLSPGNGKAETTVTDAASSLFHSPCGFLDRPSRLRETAETWLDTPH